MTWVGGDGAGPVTSAPPLPPVDALRPIGPTFAIFTSSYHSCPCEPRPSPLLAQFSSQIDPMPPLLAVLPQLMLVWRARRIGALPHEVPAGPQSLNQSSNTPFELPGVLSLRCTSK